MKKLNHSENYPLSGEISINLTFFYYFGSEFQAKNNSMTFVKSITNKMVRRTSSNAFFIFILAHSIVTVLNNFANGELVNKQNSKIMLKWSLYQLIKIHSLENFSAGIQQFLSWRDIKIILQESKWFYTKEKFHRIFTIILDCRLQL